ncbi:DUF4334 domain-containing protein [Streptomyces sp. NPDC048484]|uniref:DUF4334 domain-containing protein n=1 Tax=Streptomyces sp. NPDC048484 TaxID=3155146 RepID=UPI003441F425
MNAEEARSRFRTLRGLESGVDPDELDEVWACLPTGTIEDVLGEWQGSSFETGHSAIQQLDEVRWFGKTLRSRLDVQPAICYDDEGKLYSNLAAGNGEASLWMIEFRDEVTATMVYDGLPIFDHFKKVDEDTLFGIMNGKEAAFHNGRHYYFILDRVDS